MPIFNSYRELQFHCLHLYLIYQSLDRDTDNWSRENLNASANKKRAKNVALIFYNIDILFIPTFTICLFLF
uniref:Uncharacterized protein n=1 Tax=Heterorhabditis bacteriophora TaxID=37862 RepID=A0A1I7WHQ9_HETBA